MIRWGKRFRKVAVVLLVLLLLFAAALYFFPQTFMCLNSGSHQADVIIVLGGGGTHERPEHAAELYFQHVAPRIILSGAGDDEINRHILLKLGVPSSAIELEGNSKTTRENAKFTINIMRAEKIHSAIIVTTWYHSRRALRTFQHYGPDIKFYSEPSHYHYNRATWDHEFFRHVYWEYIKMPGYWVWYGIWPY